MRKAYSKEQISEIIERYYTGASPTMLSNETGIARSTIYAWIKADKIKPKWTKEINMREVNTLRQQCEQQKLMIDILQNAPCTIAAPLAERYEYILNLSEKYSVNLLCKTMKVANGSYYNHILRNKK